MQSGRITAVQKDNKNKYRYLIFIEDEYAFDVHEDILVKYRLVKGTEIDTNLLSEIVAAEEENRAYQYSLRYLSIRPRTAMQIERYLIDKGFSPAVATKTRERCEQQGYVDDALYAQKWVEERLRNKPRGAYMLRLELQQKGIAKEYIDRAIGAMEQAEEVDAARTLLRSRLRSKSLPLDLASERRLLAMLLRKGFSHTIVNRLKQELRDGKLTF